MAIRSPSGGKKKGPSGRSTKRLISFAGDDRESPDVETKKHNPVPRAARWQVDPVGNPNDLRDFFHAYGLEPGDDTKWAEIARGLQRIGCGYLDRKRFDAIEEYRAELQEASEGLRRAAATLAGLRGLARDYVLGYEPFAAAYPTQGPQRRGPADQGDEHAALGRRLFGVRRQAYDLRYSAWARSQPDAPDFESFDAIESAGGAIMWPDGVTPIQLVAEALQEVAGPAQPDEIVHKLDAAFRGAQASESTLARIGEATDRIIARVRSTRVNPARLEAAQQAFFARDACRHDASEGRADECLRCLEAKLEWERALLEETSSPPRDGARPEPQPYEVLDAEAQRLRDLSALVTLSAKNFNADWPSRAGEGQPEDASHAGAGQRGALREGMPNEYAMRSFVGLIRLYFSIPGLCAILERTGHFWRLLDAFHRYATDEDVSGNGADGKKKRTFDAERKNLYDVVTEKLKELGMPPEKWPPPPRRGRQ